MAHLHVNSVKETATRYRFSWNVTVTASKSESPKQSNGKRMSNAYLVQLKQILRLEELINSSAQF